MIQQNLEGLLFAVAAAAFFAFSTAALAAADAPASRVQECLRLVSAGSEIQTSYYVTAWFRTPVSLPITSPDREKA